MIHPSYVDLMKVVNEESHNIGEEPVVNSRYSIVLATAKRARQIIAGDAPMIENANIKKPLSVAVDELKQGYVKILNEEEAMEMKEKINEALENSDYVVEQDDSVDHNEE
ncbi:DNA-directed RNA polymerase subunit omega [Eubacterium oxidoreducens]|uniref:DNA-directed RNA polymerase subunit omega n=1 Tax=Eubacterium oxidoreducens TaxID=1732 RepID=A0A1G6AMI1_EUBOX|nr:DNA-directed RNA polymerase subunit omega [Eubacterium oxidoreducens]SDB09561.1 DNA-directed RNA polymerase subunit omega [Eubacterium oxidoreducens]